MTNSKQYLNNSRILIRSLLKTELPKSLHPDYNRLTDSILKRWDVQVDNWGLASTLSYWKELRLCFTKKLSGQQVEPRELRFTIGLTKDKWPKALGPVLPRLRGDVSPEELRVILTLLTLGRIFQVKEESDPDLSSITDKSGLDLEDIDPEDFFMFVMTKLKKIRTLPVKCSHMKFHPTVKRGPNGHAMRALKDEIRLFDSKENDKVLMDLNEDLHSKMRMFEGYLPDYPDWDKTFGYTSSTKKLNFAKLSKIPDKEGKTRIICQVNYWSQSALKPIHDECMGILKELPYDCTHNQGHFKSWLQKDESGTYHSVDLKNATDRFPLSLQTMVVTAIFGQKVARAWRNTMTSPVYVPWKDTTVKYSVGQPMGAYSSWPVFALTHGLLVSYLADLFGVDENKFCILGDDIVIAHDKLASKYKSYLKILEVPFSETKTMSSNTTYEFAKRWIHNNVEITPFPLSAVHESNASYYHLHEAFRKAEDRGWFKHNSGAGPGVVKEYLRKLGYNFIFIKHTLNKWREFALLPSTYNTHHENQRNWVSFLRLHGVECSCVNYQDFAAHTVRTVMARAVRKEMFENIKSLSQQGDDLWRILYYSGLTSTQGLDGQTSKLLKFLNPHLNVLQGFSEDLDRIGQLIDEDPKTKDGEFSPVTEFLRVNTVNSLLADKRPNAIVKSTSRVLKQIVKILVELKGDLDHAIQPS